MTVSTKNDAQKVQLQKWENLSFAYASKKQHFQELKNFKKGPQV